MIDFQVYSRPGIEACPPHDDVDHVIISIRTPGDPEEVKLPICDKTMGVLSLEFDDLDQAPTQPIPILLLTGQDNVRDIQLFDAEMGARVVAFIREHESKIERVIVHCDAGRSRSPGVAAAIAKMLNIDDDWFFKRYHPNRLVYRNILNAAFGTIEDAFS